jgi:hypothetical protein
VSFAAPWAWLWVLALLPVFILHFLRKKERDWPVSALFLWVGGEAGPAAVCGAASRPL